METPQTSLDRVLGVLSKQYPNIEPNTNLNNLIADSLAIVSIILEVQDAMGKDANFDMLDFGRMSPRILADAFA